MGRPGEARLRGRSLDVEIGPPLRFQTHSDHVDLVVGARLDVELPGGGRPLGALVAHQVAAHFLHFQRRDLRLLLAADAETRLVDLEIAGNDRALGAVADAQRPRRGRLQVVAVQDIRGLQVERDIDRKAARHRQVDVPAAADRALAGRPGEGLQLQARSGEAAGEADIVDGRPGHSALDADRARADEAGQLRIAEHAADLDQHGDERAETERADAGQRPQHLRRAAPAQLRR